MLTNHNKNNPYRESIPQPCTMKDLQQDISASIDRRADVSIKWSEYHSDPSCRDGHVYFYILDEAKGNKRRGVYDFTISLLPAEQDGHIEIRSPRTNPPTYDFNAHELPKEVVVVPIDRVKPEVHRMIDEKLADDRAFEEKLAYWRKGDCSRFLSDCRKKLSSLAIRVR